MKNISNFILTCFCICLLFACNKEDSIPTINSTTFTSSAFGCSSFFVGQFSDNKKLALTVRGQREELNLDTTEQVFDLSINTGLDVKLTQFNKDATGYYCNDVIEEDGPEPIREWLAQSGTAFIQILEDSINVYDWEVHFKISVKLEDVKLYNEEEDDTQTIESAEFIDVFVGWLPG